ncbi:MAG: FtsW/RodA/SpoVE family cell cycle protein [Ruminococcus sp.]|nr:FtsW/RodA/SpoVE family cell cycle protein [Ruminococcus sp.]
MKEFREQLADYFRRLDKTLILAALACSVLSVVLLNSIYVNDVLDIGADDGITQAVAAVIGFAAMITVSALDFHKFTKLWYIYVPVILLMVVLTFTSLGYQREGADDQAWLNLGFISIQPSEFLKIVFIMTFSLHLSKDEANMNHPLHMLLLLLHGAVPLGIVVLQGDYGTAVVFAMMMIMMLMMANIAWQYVAAAMVAIPAAVWVIWNYVLGDLHKNRILVLLNPGTDPEGLEYQQDLGLTALASGKIFGVGVYSGDEYISVPEVHNDFIFAYVGETLGFVGAMAVVLVLTLLCMRVLLDGLRLPDRQGMLICMGVFAMLLTHCVMNIGMVLKVMPVIGIPLPFLSAGGSATLSMYIALGLVLSARLHSVRPPKVLFDPE